MKKLNNFILFPIILGTTCLVCGGIVSGLNYVLSPIISQNSSGKVSKTIQSVFVGSKEIKLVYDSTSEDPALKPRDFDSHILQYYSVTTSDDKTGHAYLLQTDKGYSGTVTVVACYLDNNLIGLSYIEGDESSVGVSYVNKLASYINQGNPYVSGNDFSSFVSSAGSTFTCRALESVLNIAAADIIAGSSNLNFSVTTNVTIADEGFDYITYAVTVAPKDEDDYADEYQNMEGKVTFSYSISESTYKLSKLEITKSSTTSEDDYGASILAGTATDPFTQKLIAPAINGEGVAYSNFINSLAVVSSDETLFTSESKALATSYTVYSMIYGAGQEFAQYDKNTNAATKVDDTHYRARVFNATYGNLDLIATIDPENRTVLSVEFKAYSALAYPGYDNFGIDIIKGNTNSSNTKRNEFVTKFVKFPEGGISLDTFKNSSADDFAVGTGATQTATGYLEAMHLIVAEFEKGAN